MTTTSATPPPTATPTGYVYVTPDAGFREALKTPEGALVEVGSDVSWWTAAQIADLLRPNAFQLNVIGPKLKVKVQTTYASSTTASAGTTNGVYTYFAATMWLDARSNSSFTALPTVVTTHEYGHAWSNYYRYLTHQGSWTKYEDARGLTGSSLLNSTYLWQTAEIMADDYRLLFGSPEAVDPMPHLQPGLPDPRTVPGLKEFLSIGWTTS